MGSSLTEIAQTLKSSNKKVQLIYAFNGTGKTRLSRAFKSLINANTEDSEAEETEIRNRKILYNLFHPLIFNCAGETTILQFVIDNTECHVVFFR